MTDVPEANAPPPYKRGQSSADELPDLDPCNFVWIQSVPTWQTKLTGRYLIDPGLVVSQDQLEPRAAELSNFAASVICDVDIDLWVTSRKETPESNAQRLSGLTGKGPRVGGVARTTLDVTNFGLGRTMDVRLRTLGSQPVALSLACHSAAAHVKLSIPRKYKGKLSIIGQPRHLFISPELEPRYTVVSSSTTKTEVYIGRSNDSDIESTIKIEVKLLAVVFLSHVGEVWTPPKIGGDCQIIHETVTCINFGLKYVSSMKEAAASGEIEPFTFGESLRQLPAAAGQFVKARFL